MRTKSKRGNLSKDDKNFILTHYDLLTPAQIALKLERNVDVIKAFIVKHVGHVKYGEDIVQPLIEATPEGGETNELQENLEIRKQLKVKPEYKQLQQELAPDEVKTFEYKYAKFVQQFKEDILPSEEVQLFKAIKFDILMSRSLRAQRTIDLSIIRLEKTADVLSQAIKDGSATDAQRDQYARVEEQISACRQAQGYKVKEVREINKEHEGLLEALKASRQQRISRIENSKKTFIELIKELHDEEFREREGQMIGLTKLAAQKESERLAQLHKYMDGTTDNPILNSETVNQ